MAGFWSGLSATLRNLEALAADSRRLDGEVVATLRLLQYRLHWSSEALAGVEPPPGAVNRHAELADALVEARDATGDMAEAIELGGRDAVPEFLHEWRGSLFRVRLARMRLTTGDAPAASPREFPAAAAASTGLTILGVGAFVVGALTILWPVWAVGLALVAAGVLVYRP